MGWDAVVFGALRVTPGFELATARKDTLSDPDEDAVWPFEAFVAQETVGHALTRWGRMKAPEYARLSASVGRLELASYWSSGTLIEQGATLSAVLRALGARGATGTVHVVGFGEDHVFALAVSRKGVRIQALDDTAHRRLVTRAAAYLERPGNVPARVTRVARTAVQTPVETRDAVETDAAVDALFGALEAKGATVGNAGHRSPVREEAARSLSARTRADIAPRALALLTKERLAIAKQKSMTTWVSAPLEDQVHFITEVMTILSRHRHAPAAPLLWKLSSARHDRVGNAAKAALLAIIDDALLKRIFATTRKAFESKHQILGAIPRQTVETLFATASPTFQRLWG